MAANCGGCRGSLDFSPEGADLTGNIHHLPCCIKLNGPSDVSHYFKPKSAGFEVDKLPLEEAFFRGRKLMGVTVPMPLGYSGFVLGKKNPQPDKAINKSRKGKASSNSQGDSNDWEVLAKSQNLTVWNHDNLPSQDDAFLRSFHWLAVAKALHKPVTPEDLESQTISKTLS